MQIEINEGIRSILIVEDEAIVLMLMEELAAELGITDVRSCASLAEALIAADADDLDIAVLDVHVGTENTNALADRLSERDVPFVFSSGSDLSVMAEHHRQRPLLPKPFGDEEFKLVVSDAFHVGRRRREATPAE